MLSVICNLSSCLFMFVCIYGWMDGWMFIYLYMYAYIQMKGVHRSPLSMIDRNNE